MKQQTVLLEDREGNKAMGKLVQEGKAKFLYYADDKLYYEVKQ